jgi:ceramide synthetase
MRRAPPPPLARARATPAPLLTVLLLAALAALAATASASEAATAPSSSQQPRRFQASDLYHLTVPGDWFLTGHRVWDYALLTLAFAVAIPLARRALVRFAYEPLGRRMIGAALLAKRLERRKKRGGKGGSAAAAATTTTTTPRRTTRRSAAAAAAAADGGGNTANGTPAPPALPRVSAEKMRKWTESAWKMTAFSVLTGLAIYVVHDEPWMTEPETMWRGARRIPIDLRVKRSLAVSYALQTGFYLQSIPFLLMVEVRRKDFAESMAHHIITAALLAVSWGTNFTRAGVAFTLLHDVSDIFLETAKLARYCRREGAATAAFVAFALSWIALRVFYYPWLILAHILIDPIRLVALPFGVDPQPYWSIFATLFSLLWGLHLYWTYLIVMVIVRKFTRGEMDDVREEDSDDDDSDSDDD